MLAAPLERRLLDSVSELVIVVDDRYVITHWNAAAERVLGWSAAEAVGRPLRELLPMHASPSGPGGPGGLGELGVAEGAWRGEVEVLDRGGRPLCLDIEISPFPDGEEARGATRRGHLVICRDLTALMRAARALSACEARLRESEERFRNLVEQKQVGVYLIQDGRFQYINPKFSEIVGYERAEVLALPHFLALVHPDDQSFVAERQQLRLRGEVAPYSFRLQRKNGELAHVEVYGTRTDYQGSPSIIGSLVDITERTRVQDALAESEARYRGLVDSLTEGILLIDRDLHIITCNESAARLFGLTAKQRSDKLRLGEWNTLYRPSMAPLPPEEWPGQVTLRSGIALTDVVLGVDRPGHGLSWVSINTQPLRRDSESPPYAVVISARDVTERKLRDEELRRQAFYDKLTGLPNRSLFQDRVERALTQARRNAQLVAVCFIDLDGFKQINDSLGHAVGDVFLQQVAQRLSRCLREGDTVARLGGDEFTLLLPALTDERDAVRVADRVLVALRQPFYIGSHLLHVTASVGISISPHDRIEVADLLRQADAAMYRVKAAGKDGYQLYTTDNSGAATRRLHLEAQLWLALRDKQLRLCVAPVVDLATGELRGIDASPRWPHPSEGLIAPREMLSMSEDSELLVGVLRWTLRTACQQAQALAQAGLPASLCVLHVPPPMLLRRELCADLRAALQESGLLPRRLVLVLQLDRHTVEVADLVALATELAQLGVLLALGGLWDAGLPLQYLQALPLMALRLEPWFVHRLGSDPRALGLCQGLAALAHSLGLQIMADGVDSAAELAAAQRLGCDLATGAAVSWSCAAASAGSSLLAGLQRDGGLLVES
jgi:diguanylate cyclase (GGDEF)-like protein/PAS domain S-box-containing protein